MASSTTRYVVVTETRDPSTRQNSSSSTFSSNRRHLRSRSQSSAAQVNGPKVPSPRDVVSEKDIVILVMGQTGAGKSTFINLLADEEIRIGHSLESCTTEVQMATFSPERGRTCFLIDTPGFDDTHRSDGDILKEIAGFLGPLYEDGVKISGLIYLHRITDSRMGGSALKNLEVFRRLCGENCFPHVALVSTMWQELEGREGGEIGREREVELRQKRKYWGDMVEGGSRYFRHTGGKRSAENIVQWFMNMNMNIADKIVLNIQRELVDLGLELDETEAGRYLQEESAKVKERYEAELRALRLDIADVQQNSHHTSIDDIKSERNNVETAMAEVDQNIRKMRINLRQLESEKKAEFASRAEAIENDDEHSQETPMDLASMESELKAAKEQISDLEHDIKQRDKEIRQQIDAFRRQDSAKARDGIRQLEAQWAHERDRFEARRRADRKRHKYLERVVHRGSSKVANLWRALSDIVEPSADSRIILVDEGHLVRAPRRVLTGESFRSVR